MIIKKLIFALPFLITFSIFTGSANQFISNPDLIFSLNKDVLINSLTVLIWLTVSSSLFIIFVTLAQDWRLVLPVIIITSLTPLTEGLNTQNIILAGGYTLSLTAVFFLLLRKLFTYLSFSPTNLLIPSIKYTITLVLIIFSCAFYFNSNQNISQNGFSIPESLLDLSLQFAPQNQSAEAENSLTQGFQINPEDVEMLKKNPELLKQYGLDPKILDNINTKKAESDSSANGLMKEILRSQFETILKPYLSFIPIILTLTFFLSFTSAAAIIGIFLSPLIWIIFYLLEKIGFTKYQVETREVKKLVV